MSFWAKCGVVISDLECFKRSCDKHSVEYVENKDRNFKMQGLEVHATLRDMVAGRGQRREAFLVRDGGGFRLVIDSDPRYSTLTGRLGRNGGKLTRDYTQGYVSKGVRRKGRRIRRTIENPDGSLVLKVA